MKKRRNTRDSHLVILSVVAPEKNESNARNKSAKDAIREKGTSLCIVELFAWRGYTIAATQSTSQVFAIFDQITFHSANSVCPLKADKIFTNNSGALVPKATIVKPMTRGEIPNFFASEEAPDTRISAHFIRMINHKTKKT